MGRDVRAAIAPASWLVAPLACGLIWRLLALLHDSTIDTDGAYYGAVARWFAAGDWGKALDPVWPPLLPFLASLGMRAGWAVETAGVAVSLTASVASIALVALLARATGGRDVGRWAAWLAAAHPKLVSFGLQFLTEALYVACTCAVLWACVAGRGRRAAAVAGLALAAAFLTRPEAVALLPPLLIWQAWRGGAATATVTPSRWRRRLAPAAIAAATFTLAVTPYLWHVARVEGRPTLGEKGALNFYLTYRDAYARAGVAVRMSDFAAITAADVPRVPGHYEVGTFLRREPATVAVHTLANVPVALADKIPGLVGWPVFVLALFAATWRRCRIPRHAAEWLFVAWIGLVVLSIAPLFLYRRFFIATLPPLLVWAAIAIVELVARGGRRARIAAGIAIVLLALAAQWSVWRTQWPQAYRSSGRWLAAHAPAPVVVAARKPETAFYAGAEFRPLPALAAIDSLRPFLESAAATHFVADDYILPRSHPALASLVDSTQAPRWLVPVYAAHDRDHRVVVYALRQP